MDLHIADTVRALSPYLDPPWRTAVEQGGVNPPWSLSGTVHPYLRHESSRPPEALASPDQARAALDDEDADMGLLVPTALLNLSALPTVRYAEALSSAYNRWIVDSWLRDEDRLHAGLLVAPQDPAAAAEEVENGADLGFSVVVVPIVGLDPLLGDRRYDELYTAAQRRGMTVVLHVGGTLQIPGSPFLTTMFANQFEQLAMSRPMLAMANLTTMVGSGVFSRFPDLRVLFAGAGATWLTHLALRMDKEYNENRRDVPYYQDRISRSLDRQVGVVTNPWPVATSVDVPLLFRASYRCANLLFGSGYGSPLKDDPKEVASDFADADLRRAVMGENAMEWLKKRGS